jgi:hypothetical protein
MFVDKQKEKKINVGTAIYGVIEQLGDIPLSEECKFNVGDLVAGSFFDLIVPL